MFYTWELGGKPLSESVPICGVRFRKSSKVYHFDPAGYELSAGQYVIVETVRGVEYGEVVLANAEVCKERLVLPLKPVLRIAADADAEQAAENERLEPEAFDICLERIADHNLDMKLIDVSYTFDRGKILFYFKADGRVDFRQLVKDLASVFRTRIELRQIGVREEAKMLGGLGICGRPFCCSTCLEEFQPVSIKMAKEQGLSLNPTKISGTCGRLMCCLNFEQATYEELMASVPQPGTRVRTEDGHGVVTDVSILKEIVTVRLLGDDTTKSYHISALTL